MSPYIFASGLLRCGFFFCSAAAFIILLKLLLPEKKAAPSASFSVAAFFRLPWQAKHDFTVLLIPALFLSIVSVILFKAFIACDFSVEYVAQYADRTLPLFYRITAFWAGQAGSMLFWALAVGLSGVFFVKNAAYKNLRPRTRLYFCLFFLSIMAFFNFLLTVWTNPFTLLDSIPADGGGLNPLLQNPGMIFHPPLLLLGYGGFTAPACLALAQSTGDGPAGHGAKAEEPWTETARPHILGSWSLLTAGIVLGAWWAYMELGWGGYWAWDPVENASLLPWFAASAYIHTAIIGRRGGKLRRVNVFLICLTTASAFFATYLVRSGVVQSLHAFGDNGIGAPLLIFTLFFLYVATAAALLLPPSATALDDMLSREGLILFVAWLLLAVAAIILIATLWPVIINALRDVSAYLPDRISAKLPQKPMGLDAAFYNGACLPLLAMFSILLIFCPGRRWKS
ncbi:MAG: cytochrome c biogenesis protein CcsA, partial [Desulfovibrio sp.]|nr:cytochrome c biogenesis protein CcsA [Desulfovibrio sp.]